VGPLGDDFALCGLFVLACLRRSVSAR